MSVPHPMVEIWRGPLCESVHTGHAVICDASGQVIEAWGDADAVIFPRSSCKMMQALPMVEAGVQLSTERLALACASHEGADYHVAKVRAWLGDLELGDDALLCGTEVSRDRALRTQMIREGELPSQAHNQCSGKHAGFLHFNKHLNGAARYVEPDHPVQKAVRATHEELTGMDSPGFGIDGCSAPNFATTVTGLARAMAAFATATDGQGARQSAMAALRDAMILHPELVAGEDRACTDLMRAMGGKVAIKTGAEAVFVAMLPERGLGVALKIVDGNVRGSNAAMAAVLVKLGVLEAGHPATRKYLNAPILSRAGAEVGRIQPAPGFPDQNRNS